MDIIEDFYFPKVTQLVLGGIYYKPWLYIYFFKNKAYSPKCNLLTFLQKLVCRVFNTSIILTQALSTETLNVLNKII